MSSASRCAASLATAATCGSVSDGNPAATPAVHALRSCSEGDCVDVRPERRVLCSPAGQLRISVVVRRAPGPGRLPAPCRAARAVAHPPWTLRRPKPAKAPAAPGKSNLSRRHVDRPEDRRNNYLAPHGGWLRPESAPGRKGPGALSPAQVSMIPESRAAYANFVSARLPIGRH